MEKITSKIDRINTFLKIYDAAWRNATLQPYQQEQIRLRLKEIDDRLAQKEEILKLLFDIDDAGVRHASDLLTYLTASRLAYALDDYREEKEKIKQMYRLWFDIINYLLITNIFSPNDNIDRVDLGTGKYEEIQGKTRMQIVREIVLNYGERIPAAELYNLISKTANPSKVQLKEIAELLGLDSSGTRASLESIIDCRINSNSTAEDNSILIDWLKNTATDDNWESITNEFMSEKTPPFLLKNVGLARELFVFAYLTYTDIGYVIPLLLHQKLFSNYQQFLGSSELPNRESMVLDPPDFLLVKKGRVLGLELGRGKLDLVSTFSAVSGLPTVSLAALFENQTKGYSRDFGFKCNLCHIPFVICDKYQEMFVEGQEKVTTDQTCIRLCGEEKCKNCKDAIVKVRITVDEELINATVHRNCLSKIIPAKAAEVSDDDVFPLFPAVDGLEKLRLGF